MDVKLLQVCAAVTVLVVVDAAPIAGIRKSDCNAADVFWDKISKKCLKCIFCGTGYRRDIDCGHGVGGIVTCISCPTGYFQDDKHFGGTHCTLCKSCTDMHLNEARSCTNTFNAQCGSCKLGFAHDPQLPLDVGCTSCVHLPTLMEGCQLTAKPLTTTTQMTTSVPQTSAPHRSTEQSTTPKLSPPTTQNISLETSVPVNTIQTKNEDSTDTLKQGESKVVIHAGAYVRREVFGSVVGFILFCILMKTMIRRGWISKPMLTACRKSVEKDGVDPKENNNDCERRPTQNRITPRNNPLGVIMEEPISNESDSGEDGPLLKRPPFKRWNSAPAAPGVQMNLSEQFVHFQNGQTQKKPLAPPVRIDEMVKTPDEVLIEKTLGICEHKKLADLSQEIQKQICMILNPDRTGSVVESWKDLAQHLGIVTNFIDNFDNKMRSVFMHMFYSHPDTTMKTFLDAVIKLKRPLLVRTICKSIIDEHEKVEEEPKLISL